MALALALSAAACAGVDHAPVPAPPPRAPAVAAPAPPSARAESASEPEPPAEPNGEDAERVLFLATHLRTDELRKVCPTSLSGERRVRCLIELRYEDEPASRDLALTLYTETGSLAGLLPEESTDDGRGGKAHLRPARPIGANREHLRWILEAFRDYQRFLAGLAGRAPVTFRDRPVALRFFYSENGKNPSAFAVERNVGYNLSGVLNVSAEAVRSTLFHEIFHLNDGWHDRWSQRALAALYDGVVARCARRTTCLAPYSPSDTMMDGAFYAFALKGGVREYAAELGLRYYREQRLLLSGEPLPVRPLRCGPTENAEAWRLLAAEFFGGIDLTPGCPPAPG